MKSGLFIIAVILFAVSCTDTSVKMNVTPVSEEIQQVITDLYASIQYEGNEQPDWDYFRSLFIEEAFLIHNTDTAYIYMSPEDFIDATRRQMESGIIQQVTEGELYQTGEQFAGIAQVFSTYETMVITPDDTLSNRGIKSIQLMQEDGAWKIASIVWHDETRKYSIPKNKLSTLFL